MIKDKIIETLEINFQRADHYISEIRSYQINLKTFDHPEKVKTIDGFIYRFTKIQDIMSEKLFPAYLMEVQEYRQSTPLVDVFNRLERLGVMESAEEWKRFRKLRNNLTHEYPDSQIKIIEGINESFGAYETMQEIFNKIKSS